MASYISDGVVINLTAPTGGYTGDTPVALTAGTGGIIGVPKTDADAGDLCAVALDGVHYFNIKKTGVGEGWTPGIKVYLTATGALTATAGSNTPAGRCVDDGGVATGATACHVKINFGT